MRELLKIAAFLSFQRGYRYCILSSSALSEAGNTVHCSISEFPEAANTKNSSISAISEAGNTVNSSISEFAEAANQCGGHLGIRSFKKMRIL